MIKKDNMTDAVEIANDIDTSNDSSNWEVSDDSGDRITLGL